MNFIEITVAGSKVLVNVAAIKTVVAAPPKSFIYFIGDDNGIYVESNESKLEIEDLIQASGSRIGRKPS